MENRNVAMTARVEGAAVDYPFRFTILGDSAATPRPVGDAIFTEMLGQMRQLPAAPLFMANLGDFGGGWGLCSHYGGSCHGQKPPDRGSLYHFVELTVEESGRISGRVIPAYQGINGDPAFDFTTDNSEGPRP